MNLIKKFYNKFMNEEERQRTLLSQPVPAQGLVPGIDFLGGGVFVSSSSAGSHTYANMPQQAPLSTVEEPALELDEAVNKVIAKMGGQDGSNDNE